jgi:hypothetical protein
MVPQAPKSCAQNVMSGPSIGDVSFFGALIGNAGVAA